MSLFECVPNISEGRDPARIDRIVAPARTVPGVVVLDVERNADHHRAVVSLAGEGEALLEAVFALMRVAVSEIDLNHHRGEHPRMGAVDVVPFIPLGGSSMEEAVQLANRLGERVARELSLPVYLYGEAARRPERRDLATVRSGEFEGLREVIATDPARQPDLGEARLHPTAGAVAIGARAALIAYNVYLTTPDVAIAKRIAHALRGRDGGLAEVKALGFEIRERNRAQVSMNLTDYRRTPIPRVMELLRREAARYGVGVESSEIVGLVPEEALLDAAEYYLQLHPFDRGALLEPRLRAAGIQTGGATPRAADTGSRSIRDFVDRLAARTPTPGGGSAAAISAALGAGLGRMVVAYAAKPDDLPESLRPLAKELDAAQAEFLELADRDSEAYESVRGARRKKRDTPDDAAAQTAWEQSVRMAAEVPLQTARLALRLEEQLEAHRGSFKPALVSDLVTSIALLRAAREGAVANANVNLADLREAGIPVSELSAEVERIASHRSPE